MKIGIPYETFWSLTPNEFEVMFDGYMEQQRHINYMNWINGAYTLSALQSVLSGIFGKKGSKPLDYCKEPIPIFKEKERELTEEEKKEEQLKVLHMLEAMQASFEATHPKKNKKSEENQNQGL